jgi:purine-nucleoside phosphorylase
MKNFEVHELVDGWTGQAGSLEEAIQLRDSIIRDYGAENVQLKITAEVDEDDLKRERLLNH